MAKEVVAGSDRVDFYLTYVDENKQVINITGAQEVKLQGKSAELPSVPIDMTGAIFDAPNGVAKFTGFGNIVTQTDLAAQPHATYKLRGKLKDSGAKTTWTDELDVKFLKQPLS